MYRNGTDIVRSTVQCTEVVGAYTYMYRSGRTEVVRTMYRNGHVPNWSYLLQTLLGELTPDP